MRRRVAVSQALLPLICPLIVATAAPAARGDFLTSVAPTVTEVAGQYQYSYTLTNLTSSTISAYAFALAVDPTADLQAIVTPDGWDVTYNPGDTEIDWSALTEQDAIAPGAADVFGFTSPIPPLSGDFDVTGFDPDRFQFYDNNGATLTPTVRPVPEPAGAALVAIGGLLLALRGRRKTL